MSRVGLVVRRCAPLIACLACIACSKGRPWAEPDPTCRNGGDDLQRVDYTIDAAFIEAHRVYEVIDPVFWTANIYGTARDYDRCLRTFTRPQRLVHALNWYAYEVNSGGHDQFFSNSTGIVFPDALAGFQELGLTEGVAILTEAARRLGGTPARERAERQAQLERSRPRFDDLDTRLYALDDKDGLERAIKSYMRSRSKDFMFRGTVLVPASSVPTQE